MVGITVILAATVSVAVLGFGEELGGTEITAGDCNQPVSFDPTDMGSFADDVSANCQGIALWSFDDSYNQDTAVDSIGSNDGAVDSSVTYSSGVRNTGLTYGGSDTPVVIPHDKSFNFKENESFTISAWIQIDSYGFDSQTILAKQPASDKGYSFLVSPSKELGMKVGDGSSYMSVTGGTVPEDDWVHVATVVDRQRDTITLYIDGQEVGSDDISLIGSVESTEDIHLGDGTNTDSKLVGSQDEVRIFDESLSKSEIQDFYQNKR